MSQAVLRKSICGLAAVLALGGCGGKAPAPVPEAPESPEGTVRVQLTSYQQTYQEDILAACREQFPSLDVQISQDERWTDAIDTIRTELMSGGGPDVLFDPHLFFEDIDKTMNTRVFADLLPLVERDFGTDGLNPRVLPAGRRDGKQYVLPLTYNMPLLLTTEEALAQAGVNGERCKESQLAILEEAARYAERTENTPAFYSSPFFALYFPDLLGLPFLDYEKRTADFSFPEYRPAVELYKPFYPFDILEDDDMIFTPLDGYRHIKNREAVFECYNFNTGEELFWNASALAGEEHPQLVPMAAQDGKYSAWVYQSAAIPASCKNPEAAWAFLKVMLSPEIQNNWYNVRNLPVLSSCLEDRISASQKEAGEPMEEMVSGSQIILAPLSDAFYQEFRRITENIGHTAFTYSYASTTTLRQMEPYYKGERSFESCLEELENTAMIYMSE